MKKILLALLLLSLGIQAACNFCFQQASQITGLTVPRAIAFSSDGTCFAAANGNDTVTLYSFNASTCTATLVQTLGIADGISSPQQIAFSPNGSCFAVANLNSPGLQVYSRNGCGVNTPASSPSGPSNAFSVAFSPDSSCIVVGDASFGVPSFSLNGCTIGNGGTPVSSVSASSPLSVAFSPNGSCVAIANFGTGVDIYAFDQSTCSIGSKITTIPLAANADIYSIKFSSSGSCLAYSTFPFVPGANSYVAIHTFDQSTCMPSASPITTLTAANGVDRAQNIAFSPDGSCLAAASFGDFLAPGNTTPIYAVNTGTCAANTLPNVILSTVGDRPFDVAYHPSGSCIAICNQIGDNVTFFSLTAAHENSFTICRNTPSIRQLTEPVSGTYSLNTAPSHGNVVLNSDGSFTYTPNFGYLGLDSFNFIFNDGMTSTTCTAILNVICCVCSCKN